MGANDNGDQASKPPTDSRIRDIDRASEDASLGAASTGVALSMLYVDAAHSLSLAMQNAVAEQQNAWAVHRSVTFKAVERFLNNDVGDRAVDLLLGALAKPQA
jgi:hypothetical protein